jgi:hypothetical protein
MRAARQIANRLGLVSWPISFELKQFNFSNSPETGCSSFVEEKTTACHSERSEESPHLKAQSVRKNAGILRFAQNDRQWGYPLRMKDIAYETPAP